MQNTITKSLSIFLLVLFLISACSSPISAPTAQPTLTLTSPATSTPLSTNTPIPSPTPTLLPPTPARAQYTLAATIDYDAHTVTVDESIAYPNHTGNQLNALVIAVEPNLWTGAFTLNSITIDGTPTTTYTLNGQRLDIALSAFLMPEQVMKINIQYSLNLPFAEQEDPNIARPRIFGYTKHQLNLVNWYPFVVPYLNGDWVLHETWFYGEHLVYDAADYVVDVKFTDPANAPIVASSGEPFPNGDTTRYIIDSARAFVISASREFQVSSTQVGDVTVSSYYYPLYKQAGQDVLLTTAEALQLYSQRYGAYNHKTLSVVMGDFNDGMEYSGFFYLSFAFYNLYKGQPNCHLISIAAHEASHQWWFDQVGNDQAQQPWLDESLATYSELIYYENYHPEVLKSWWWPIRIDLYNPQGFIDIPIYDANGAAPYRASVYFQGAHFLNDLRARIGDQDFFAFIQDYFTQEQGKIATADEFFTILKMHTKTDYADLVHQYFRNIYP